VGSKLFLAVVVAAAAAIAVVPSASPASPPLNGIQFISVCGFSHRGPDDPIVYPNRPGVSHDHTFVGNTSTDAFSTPTSLRAAGTTCSRRGDTAAYWAPTLLFRGSPVVPVDAIVYYRRTSNAKVRPFPFGLRMVAGNSHAFTPQSFIVTAWDCGDATDVPRSSTIPLCPTGSNLRLRVNFPDCWDGKNLDSLDHQRHMAYSSGGRCPRSHPVPVPAISLILRYPTPAANGPTDAYLASGGQLSAHADFINSWDEVALTKLVNNCLNKYRHCGTGS
jgi:hypothetical protein